MKYHHATRSDHKRDLPKTERAFALMEQFAVDSARQYEEASKGLGMRDETEEADNSQQASLDAAESVVEPVAKRYIRPSELQLGRGSWKSQLINGGFER